MIKIELGEHNFAQNGTLVPRGLQVTMGVDNEVVLSTS